MEKGEIRREKMNHGDIGLAVDAEKHSSLCQDPKVFLMGGVGTQARASYEYAIQKPKLRHEVTRHMSHISGCRVSQRCAEFENDYVEFNPYTA